MRSSYCPLSLSSISLLRASNIFWICAWSSSGRRAAGVPAAGVPPGGTAAGWVTGAAATGAGAGPPPERPNRK